MKRLMPYLLASMALLMASFAMALPAAAPGKSVPRSGAVTLNGEIIDPQCYFTHDSRGPSHAKCAAMCAKGGQTLAFLDDATGTVYPLIAGTHGGNPNDGMLPHLGKSVQVKGVVYHKASNSVLLIQSVVEGPAKAK